MKGDTVPISVRITDTEYGVIKAEIRRGRAMSRSDFVRQAIREKIERIELRS